MQRRPLVGWLLVGASAIVAAFVVWFVSGFARFYGPTTGVWADGASFAFEQGLGGLLLAVGLAVLAIVFGRGVWVRVAAALVLTLTVLGLAAAGGAAAVSRYETAPKSPACAEMVPNIDPAIEEAFDELEHPGWVDTIVVGPNACAVVVRNLDVDELVDFYGDQLTDRGWTVVDEPGSRFVAERGEYRFEILDSCDEEPYIAIRRGEMEMPVC
ncbi:hypothetical protein ABZ477_03250 [Microbacterium sp. NPDC019599]|uniref:hypothetical protein n=1 Tax=Microbacterium sp. NPDC019599 TaxID=3154690 RepID=UPI0033D413CF